MRLEAAGALLAPALPALAAAFAATAAFAFGASLTLFGVAVLALGPLGAFLTGAFLAFAALLLGAFLALTLLLRPVGLGLFGGLLSGDEGGGLSARLVFEVDVEALVRQLARGDVGEGLLRLERPQHAIIVLGVLLVVFGQHPVAGGRGVARQLLIALVHGLRVAADLDVLGPLRVPRTVRIGVVGVVGAAGLPVASALTLHALEVSHGTITVLWGDAAGRGKTPGVS